MDVHTEKEYNRDSQREQKENKEQGSGRPRAGSESSRNPVSKVMDLIRHRSHSALSAEDKRKAVSNSLRLYFIYRFNTKYFELCTIMHELCLCDQSHIHVYFTHPVYR